MFDDRPVEINELTYVIKQDLSSLNSQISSLQSLSKTQQSQSLRGGAEQEGEHNKNVRKISRLQNNNAESYPGRRPITRQTSRRRHQLQRSPRSPHQKPPSLALPHRKLRLLRLSTHPTPPPPSPIRLPPLPYSHQIRNAPTRLPEPKPRHPKPRPLLNIHPPAKRPSIRRAAPNDGRSTTHKHIHQYARRSYRYDRADYQRVRRCVWPISRYGFGARVYKHPPPLRNCLSILLTPSQSKRTNPTHRRQHRRRSR